MDFHQDLKLPAEAIAQIADDVRKGRADQFGVQQVELYHNAEGAVFCLLDGPDEEAIRRHHAALGVDCGGVHQIDGVN
jgi:hypothetical protein